MASSVIFEYVSIHSVNARGFCITVTVIAGLLAFLVVDVRLTNENCYAKSAIELARRTSLLRLYVIVIVIVEAIIAITAGVVYYIPAMTVYWPGVAAALIVFPVVILGIGYYCTRSRLLQE